MPRSRSSSIGGPGRLAQMARAPALQAGGRWFEPSTAHPGLAGSSRNHALSRCLARPAGCEQESSSEGASGYTRRSPCAGSAWRRRCTLSRDIRACLLPYLAVSSTLSAAGVYRICPEDAFGRIAGRIVEAWWPLARRRSTRSCRSRRAIVSSGRNPSSGSTRRRSASSYPRIELGL
jgi:hypothetical protein